MILAIPFTKPHANLEKFTKLLQKHGKQPKHKLLVLAYEDTQELAGEFVKQVGELFGSSELLASPSRSEKTNEIEKLNGLFQLTARTLCRREYDPMEGWLGFVWCEPDTCVPLRADWLDVLGTEFHNQRKVCMGPVEFLWEGDRKNEGEYLEKGPHIPRASVYSVTVGRESTMLNFLARSFDVEMQYELARSCWDTNLIQHNFCTSNYARAEKGKKAGKIECSGGLDPEYPINYAKPVSEDAVLLVGCVDGSLLDLMLSDS